jgi:hypothetical protein
MSFWKFLLVCLLVFIFAVLLMQLYHRKAHESGPWPDEPSSFEVEEDSESDVG